MESINKIIVSLQFGKEEIEVGELLNQDKTIFFKYYNSFLSKNIEISPIKLKVSNQLLKAEYSPFDGLHGVFADSLPDGWGALLLNRELTSKGININNVSILERLAYVGNSGMGALIYRPEKHISSSLDFKFKFDEIAKACQQIIAGESTEVLDEIFNLGGSSGGARPKILVGYNPKDSHLIADSYTLPQDYEHWIIKFPSSFDKPDIANIEYAYYKMAIAAGIDMSFSKFFVGESGLKYFGTKRFDRITNQRLHMHSAAGIMHDNFRLSSMDYGNLMDCAFKLENHEMAYQKILRLAAFNVFANNRDDHSKNFSFLMDADGNWRFAPAYDLTFSYSSHGMHSTMVAGESANPSSKNLLELANHFSIKNAKTIIEEVKNTVMNWNIFAEQAQVSKSSKTEIWNVLKDKK